MKKIIVLSLGIVFISGCLTRTYTIYKPRKDTQISGNQGYIMGKPPLNEKKSFLPKMRPITVMEIELGSHKPIPVNIKSSAPALLTKESLQGVAKSSNSVLRQAPAASTKKVSSNEPLFSPVKLNSQEKYRYYTVKKNDTLQKISYKFYGTTKKWKLIYEENKGIIKNPDKVYLGTKLKIPVL